MKKIYEPPSVEKIRFNYRDQVVVASGAMSLSDTDDGGGGNNGDGKWYGSNNRGHTSCYKVTHDPAKHNICIII